MDEDLPVDDEVKDVMQMWFWSQLKMFYAICFEERGDYVEEWYTLHVSQIVVREIINKFTILFEFD